MSTPPSNLVKARTRGGAIALALSLFAAASANAQYCAPPFVGDLNNDTKVDQADINKWNADYAAGLYSPCADLTRNGALDSDDLAQLKRAVDFAKSSGGGLGPAGRIPAFTISELRSAQPDPADPQQRFVEFRVPDNLPANYIFLNKFNAGYFLLLVSRNNSTSQAQGVIKSVINLQGVTFPSSGAGKFLALVVDASFSLAVPAGSVPTVLPAGQSISFANQNEFNTTWFLVYRRPNGPGYTAPVPFPAVGQRVDANQNCVIDPRYTNSSMPPPNKFPAWDIVLDAISVDRTLVTTGVGGRGCIYAHGPLYEALPFSADVPAFHVYRECLDKELIGLKQEVTFGLDTPGSANACAAPEYCGSPTAGACAQVHATPFCRDFECCQFVCAQPATAHCCTVSWDQLCVNEALISCGACGLPGTGSCLVAHTSAYCSTLDCCDEVCLANPACCLLGWDASCVDLAVSVCLECGADVLPNGCFQESVFPYCSDSVCCSNVCLVDPACCSIVWDSACVQQAGLMCQTLDCGNPTAGDCCLSHGNPFCSDAACCETICPLDPFCCETLWDVQCVNAVLQFCTELSCACGGGGAAADCFIVHATRGCVSTPCCNSVCNSDPFCCGVTWDASCVAAAGVFCAVSSQCKQGTGSCLLAHATPGCDDPACCDAVCAVDPDCCDLAWDQGCVDAVPELCGGCGDVFAGDCLTPHESPHCDDDACCEAVCAFDSFCCKVAWDINCATAATSLCPRRATGCGDPTGRTCFVASFLQGCSDSGCCEFICKGLSDDPQDDIDPYCCIVQWDAICAGEALTFAQLGMGCDMPTGSEDGRGNCLAPHATKGCSDQDCAVAVCSIDENCCRIIWDADCVTLAEYACIDPNGCPGTESAFAVHTSPGASDASCCNAVCFVMPDCCEIAWTQPCVVLATQRCKPASTWIVPCVGSCLKAHDNPGCEDIACASAVCFADALCCTELWDQDCASLARGLCCGFPGCGNDCNGSCLTTHFTPFCSDPACCTAVCAEDPYCCQLEWDAFCVEFAYQRCARGCGNAEAGSCFVGHIHAGCADAICCIQICRDDPFCCDTGWDSACGLAAQAAPQCASDLVCGDPDAGSCCSAHPNTPKCRDAACCTAICALDPICCDFGWDLTCVGLAIDTAACDCAKACGDACADSCCSAHLTPNCNDLVCCTAVCAIDAFCCDTQWDEGCAAGARQVCVAGTNPACPPPPCGDPFTGSCCVPHATPSCDHAACCDAVCLVDPICCTAGWDEGCVKLAVARTTDCNCDGPSCGSPETDSCFTPHLQPFCDQAECCQFICQNVNPLCCSIAWDEACVKLAYYLCTAP